MRLRINPFIATVSTVAGLGFFYIGTQLIGPLSAPLQLRAALWLLLAAPFGLVLWLPFGYWRREDDEPQPRYEDLLLWGSYLSMGLLSFVLVLVALRDFFLLGIEGYSLAARFFHSASAAAPGATRSGGAWASYLPPPALLDWHGSAWILLLALALVALGLLQARKTPAVARVEVPVRGLPPELDGFAIAQISDLHVGSTIRRGFVEAVVRQVNALEPDLIALTGDLADGLPEQLREDFAPLAGLRAREGAFYVTGNHEYYWGASLWISEVMRIGHTPLLNSGRLIRRGRATLFVAGVTDRWSERFEPERACDPAAAARGGEQADFRVLLSHQPKTAERARDAGFDLQLSGHTHGGQFIPWTWIVGFVQPFARGLHRFGRMWVYVNRGTGYWGPPLRLGSPSEITLLRLKRESPAQPG